MLLLQAFIPVFNILYDAHHETTCFQWLYMTSGDPLSTATTVAVIISIDCILIITLRLINTRFILTMSIPFAHQPAF